MQQTETRIQMIKMVNEFKLTVVHFARRCRSVVACGFTTGQKNCGKSGLGHRAAGLRAAGPPWGAGRWAADLLLAKPLCTWTGARHTTSIRPMQWHFSQFSLFLVYF